jgi:hypothetical protein
VRAIAKALNDKGGFERLGEIVAVDLYNHNTDRFNWSHALGKKSQGMSSPLSTKKKPVRYLAIRNIGNVLLALEGGQTRPVGLDSYEATSKYRNPQKTVEEAEKGLDDDDTELRWGGHLLALTKGARFRKAFAKDILVDLNLALGQRDRSFCMFSKQRLHDDGDKLIVRGMEKATLKLLDMLRAKCRADDAPRGLASRLSIIREY